MPIDWKIVVSASIVVVGWFVANWLASNRETKKKKKEVRIEYLLEAYRSIASAANRGRATSDDQKLQIESAIEDIQLLGNQKQLKALADMIDSGEPDFTRILEEIRDDLRSELGLDESSRKLLFYRMDR